MSSNATIVRRRPAGDFDAYGDPVEGAVDTPLTDCFVAPRSSADIADRGRAGVTIDLTLYGPVGTDLQHTDQVLVDDVLYDIDGDSGVWKSPLTGWQAGVEVALRRAVG